MNKHEGADNLYREAANPNAQALENMRKKIEAEGKYGIYLPEDLPPHKKILFEPYNQALKSGVKPSDIILYSLRTGVAKYVDLSLQDEPHNQPLLGSKNLVGHWYQNKNFTGPVWPLIFIEIDTKKNKAEMEIAATK
ncbi:MAG: hypothetical protein HYT15_01225 [Candidatus Magasanikbacteria bacterium]|nr:hypothetical protein [Candidatus Magasanikbacteria bacterium]